MHARLLTSYIIVSCLKSSLVVVYLSQLFVFCLSGTVTKRWKCICNSHFLNLLKCLMVSGKVVSFLLSCFLCICSLLSTAVSSSSSLVRSVFIVSSQVVYSLTGYNSFYGIQHLSDYNSSDFTTASFITHLRHLYGLHSPCEGIISHLSSL